MTVERRVAWWLTLAAIFGAIVMIAEPAGGQTLPPDGVYEVTAYTCPPHCGATASGAQVGPGSIAAPAWIPFGATLLVDGWYAGVVTDRGGAIYGNRLDIWLPSYYAAINWGRRWVWVQWIPPDSPTDDAEAEP